MGPKSVIGMAQKVVYAVNGVRGLVLWDSFLFPYEFLLPHMKKGDPRDWVGTSMYGMCPRWRE